MFAIIDIETTGGRQSDRITEIAIILHDGSKITGEFTTLINPEIPIPYFITRLTGITNEMVADAPRFYEVAKKIVELTSGKIIVAHNASFDYNFIRNEFKSLGYDFKRKHICTVRLSRKLVPGHHSYNLDNICRELGIIINDRHRAAGDALATAKLFEYLVSINQNDKDLFSGIRLNALSNLHPALDKTKIEELPEETGVYFFYNEKGELIYVGKSKNIYNRVMSHFSNLTTRKSQNMRDAVADIGFELTGSELVALLLESEQIKKNKPVFNRSQRRTLFDWGIFDFNDEYGYINFKIARNDGKVNPIATYESYEFARQGMEKMAEKFQLCHKLCGLYETNGACFHYSILQCRGACLQNEPNTKYNSRAEEAIRRFELPHRNFYIIDKGRQNNEKAVIKIENGAYIGFGFTDNSFLTDQPDSFDQCIKKYLNNRDIQQIIRNYLRRNKVEKIVLF